MVRLDYRWTIPYRYEENFLRPLVSAGLLVDGQRFVIDCLLDTGAERTLLDGQLLRAAEIDIWAGDEVRFQGFMGAGLVCYEHNVRLAIREVEMDIPVCFSATPLIRQVLGRDVLTHFQVGLRERYLEIYLSPET